MERFKEKLAFFSWLNSPGPQTLFSVFSSHIRFVGGAVRDSLLGLTPKDFDLATPLRPEKVLEYLKKSQIPSVPTGLPHGTVTAIIERTPYQITTLRKDMQTDGRHALVAFTSSWQADAARRDFTFNALFIDQQGNIFDYFNGISDLFAGRVRFIGPPAQRIEEDYLRILRFFRFQAFYGRQPFTDSAFMAALDACIHYKSFLKKLSTERIRNEFLKMLAAPHPAPVLHLLSEKTFSLEILDTSFDWKTGNALFQLEDFLGTQAAPLVRLAALCESHQIPPLALSQKEKQFFCFLKETQKQSLFIPELLYRFPLEYATGYLFLRAATLPPGEGRRFFESQQATIDSWVRPCFPLKGTDVMDLHPFFYQEKKWIGRLLHTTKQWWMHQNFQPSRTQCLKYLQKNAANVIKNIDKME